MSINLKQFSVKATIPTGAYANIQPEITVEAETMEQASDYAMPFIQKMFNDYSDTQLKSKGVTEKLKSFNEEVELDFDRVAHVYTYEGKKLESASGFVSRHSKPFDKLGVSKKCEGSWAVSQADILDLWESNGNAAAGFGTAVHAVLEHYFKWKACGEQIMQNSKKEVNAALPNHPFLQSLIIDLEKLMTDEGDNLQEILISNVEKGYCGLVDNLLVLDTEKKLCRIRDYKIAYEVDKKSDKLLAPFDLLPPNKLSKYQVQLSFYANLLQLSGWTVEGLDIFAYDGDWKKHTFEVLEVIK